MTFKKKHHFHTIYIGRTVMHRKLDVVGPIVISPFCANSTSLQKKRTPMINNKKVYPSLKGEGINTHTSL